MFKELAGIIKMNEHGRNVVRALTNLEPAEFVLPLPVFRGVVDIVAASVFDVMSHPDAVSGFLKIASLPCPSPPSKELSLATLPN